jgi:hypothetical protein
MTIVLNSYLKLVTLYKISSHIWVTRVKPTQYGRGHIWPHILRKVFLIFIDKTHDTSRCEDTPEEEQDHFEAYQL